MLAGFVLWTEFHPIGVACGGISTMCGASVRNYATAVDMYATDHYGKLPQTLDALYPNYLKHPMECSGTFNGCRSITFFGVGSIVRTLTQPRPPNPAVPTYRTYLDAKGVARFEVRCERKHRRRYFYSSEKEEFSTSEGR